MILQKRSGIRSLCQSSEHSFMPQNLTGSKYLERTQLRAKKSETRVRKQAHMRERMKILKTDPYTHGA